MIEIFKSDRYIFNSLYLFRDGHWVLEEKPAEAMITDNTVDNTGLQSPAAPRPTWCLPGGV